MDITKKELKQLFRQTSEFIEWQADQYGLEVEDHTYERLGGILTATSREAAMNLVIKVRNAHEVHCFLRGKRPKTPHWYEKQARNARRLAKSMMLKGDDEAAEKQEQRARRYETEALKMQAQPAT